MEMKLSNQQENILNTEIFYPNTDIHNIGGHITIKENVDFELLEKACNIVKDANEIMNVKFYKKDAEVVQKIVESQYLKIKVLELQDESELEKYTKDLVEKPFKIYDNYLYRFTFFKLKNQGGIISCFHHLISDAWSFNILISEIVNIYSKLKNKEDVEMELPKYSDYIEEMEKYKNSKKYAKDKTYWEETFTNPPDLTYISTSKLNTNLKSEREVIEVNEDIKIKIEEFCDKNRVSKYSFFMAIFGLYLAKINSTDSSIIGTPILNRSNVKEKNTMGMFTSTVPFKYNIDYNLSFEEYIKDVSKNQLTIFRHQRYPYLNILKDVKEKHDLQNNLYDFVLSYQNARADKTGCDFDYETTWQQTSTIPVSCEVHFYDMDSTGKQQLIYNYQLEKFSKEDILNLHDRIMKMVEQAIDNKALKDIEILSEKDKNFYKDYDDTEFKFNKDILLMDILEKSFKKNKHKVAMVFKNEEMTYEEIDKKSNQVANMLLEKGVTKDDIVGIMLKRGFELIIFMLGVLKTGASYVLVDPLLPEDRIIYMLENANSPLVITKLFINYNKINPDEYLNYSDKFKTVKSSNDNRLCIIYTSGSTGLPKGSQLRRKGLVNLLKQYDQLEEIDKCDRFLSVTTVAFDLFIAEIYLTLYKGKTIIMADEDEQVIPSFLAKLIKEQDADFIFTTPSKMSLLLNEDALENLKVIQLAGEVFKPTLYKEMVKRTNAVIHNAYGPSECTVYTTIKRVTDPDDLTIGKPVINTTCIVENHIGNRLPPNYPGEMVIRGENVAIGYINKFDFNGKYNTGDIMYVNDNKELVYMGRKDNQIKLHGLRIELAEITKQLLKIPGTKNAITVIKNVNNSDCICSYIISSSKKTDDDIKKIIAKALPVYMIPTHIVFMEKFPITINGKIDKKKLPDIVEAEKEFVLPETKTEIELTKIWLKVLGDTEKIIGKKSNFFELGGDSLASIKLISEVYNTENKKMEIKDIFDYPTLEQMASLIDSLENVESDAENNEKIEKARKKEYYKATSFQKSLYYECKKDDKQIAYNEPLIIEFEKRVDEKKLEQAIKNVIENNQVFKIYFVAKNNEIYQKLADKVNFNLEIREEMNEEFIQAFDLEKAPLLHAELDRLENKDCLQLDVSHLIMDGKSLNLFVDEIAYEYNKLVEDINDIKENNKEENNKENKIKEIDFLDYTEYINQKEYEEEEKYWLSKYEGEIPVLDFMTEYERKNQKDQSGRSIYSKIQRVDMINSVCKELNITPYMFFLGAYYILLYKYTMQEDIIVGTPVNIRSSKEVQDVMGLFINTLAIRQSIKSYMNFSEFVSLLKTNILDSMKNKNYPFEQLVNNLDIQRDASRNVLFNNMFIYESSGIPNVDFGDLNASIKYGNIKTSKFDFSMEIMPEDTAYNIRFEYANKLFSRQYASQMLECYQNIINEILADTTKAIAQIDMFKRKDSVLKLDYDKEQRVIDLFNAKVKEMPNKEALVYKDKVYTYKELNSLVVGLANSIRKNKYYKEMMKSDSPKVIGLMTKRRAELIVGMLAILKAGCGYLPIDPSYPKDRVKYIIEDSKINIILTEEKLVEELDKNIDLKTICLDNKEVYEDKEDFETKSSSQDIAYMIYTSGSTGLPKGCMIKQQNVVNYILSLNEIYDFSDKTIISVTTMCFDIFVVESLLPLCSGFKTVFTSDEEQHNPKLLNEICKKHKVNFINTTPSKYSLLISDEEYIDFMKNMKLLFTSGEPITIKLLNKLRKITDGRIMNMYAPTETTVHSTYIDLTERNEILIGKPIHNVSVYVLDKDMNEVPDNVPGKLYIGGDCVTAGYINRPELTAEKFIEYNNELVYDTGDIAKFNKDGELICLGRTDFQIKLNGLRIETTEIEKNMLSYPSVTEAVVSVKEINDRQILCGYFVANKRIEVSLLKNRLAKSLPRYMIPTYMIQLKNFEYTPNGKLDRKQLPEPEFKHRKAIKAKTKTEKDLVNIWKNVLSLNEISTDDDFFDIGGDSLTALRLQMELMKYEIDITYGDIFKYTTISEMADYIDNNTDIKHEKYKSSDFRKVNKVLKNNAKAKLARTRKKDVKSVLVLGATGFLGIHILAELLKEDDITIYTIIRSDPSTSPENKLKNKFKYYFGSDLSNIFGTRLFVIGGEVTEKNFGLTNEEYNYLGTKVDAVINSAALVKHYGDYKTFKKVNVDTVQNVIDFCKIDDKKFYQISTISVSGNTLVELGNMDLPNKEIDFTEKDLFINQPLDNVYVRSKFEAEKMILEEVANKDLDAMILRVGNLTHRYVDGKFQENKEENAFLNRIKAFMKLRIMPEYMCGSYIEFSPVDKTAEAISKVIQYDISPKMNVLHLYNSNHLYMDKLLEILEELDNKIEVLDDEEFNQKLRELIFKTNDSGDELSVLLNDMDKSGNLLYETNIKIQNNYTNDILKKLDFSWPIIDIDYIEKILKNL